MEGLTQIEQGELGATAVPLLARVWSMPDSRKFIFKLKENVLWNDGEPLRAKHFIQAWKRLLSHPNNTPYASLLYPVVNARAFSEGRVSFGEVGFESPDPFTLIIRLKNAMPNFPWIMSHPATWPIRKELPIGQLPSVTLGPFQLESPPSQTSLRYIRNPKYHAKAPGLDGIVVRITPASAMRAQLFLNGETDFVDEMPLSQAPQLMGNSQVSYQQTPTLVALVFNTQKKPFHEHQVREAFEHATQRDEVMKLMKWPHVASSKLLPPALSPAAPYRIPRYTPLSAKQFLAQYKWESPSSHLETSSTSSTFARPLLARSAYESAVEVSENLQAQWLKNLGIKIELVNTEEHFQNVETGALNTSPSMFLVEVKWDLLRSLGGFEFFAAQHIHNLARWRDKAFDQLLAEMQSAPDMITLSAHLNEAEELLVTKERIVLPLFFKSKMVLRRENIKNLSQNPIEIWNFRDTTMD